MVLQRVSALFLFITVCLFATAQEALFIPPGETTVVSTPAQNPLMIRLAANPVLRLTVYVPAGAKPVTCRSLVMTAPSGATALQKLDVFFTDGETQFSTGNPVATTTPPGNRFNIPVDMTFSPGLHTVWLSAVLKEGADPDGKIELHCTGLQQASGPLLTVKEEKGGYKRRIGIAVRKAGDDRTDTYRIPGIVQTDRKTLIAVYDIRYDNSKDLPGNIDVGMSRSVDGGRSWEPMKTVIKMGGPQENSGAGDPSVLFDPATHTIWVAALWSKGNHSIAGSGPGLSPDVSGQLVLVSSADDGNTWSAPVNITAQVKDPATKILFQGPGNGIAMQDGKLVFPAQYWDAANMPHSTLIWSADHGHTWKRGAGAKPNTTECQLVETLPGTLMLNMRDNRGNFRSVATTTDMGTTWTEHSTSTRTLPDPVCMGSLIKTRVNGKNGPKDLLFFSNPYSGSRRDHITIQCSSDLGASWPAANRLLIDERPCYGYSALTRIDDQTIGLLYEGTKDLYFVRVKVQEIIKWSL